MINMIKLLLLLPIIVYAADELTPSELEILKRAAVTAQVEPWDPHRVYPDIVNDVSNYIEPPVRTSPSHVTDLYVRPIKDKGHKNVSKTN